ncbi:MAG: DUF1127 domain-containing protein [Rhodobacteraceae bacterium]|nr:DUF1127 domain-containing protein [Paracoccaceae bacterium]
MGSRLRNATHAVRQHIALQRRYRQTLDELSNLRPHELSDLGIAHGDIHRVAWQSANGL